MVRKAITRFPRKKVHVNEFLREYFWLLLFILHLVGILNLTVLSMGALLVAEMVKNPQQCGRPGLDPWVGKILWGGHGNPLQYSCLENPHGQRRLVGYIQSMGSQRVGHDWATKHSPARHIFNTGWRLIGYLLYCDSWFFHSVDIYWVYTTCFPFSTASPNSEETTNYLPFVSWHGSSFFFFLLLMIWGEGAGKKHERISYIITWNKANTFSGYTLYYYYINLTHNIFQSKPF